MAAGARRVLVLRRPLEFLSGAHLGMLVAHVGAALVVVLWLAAGERALWRLVGGLRVDRGQDVVGAYGPPAP